MKRSVLLLAALWFGIPSPAVEPPAQPSGSHATISCGSCHRGNGTVDCDRCHKAASNPHPVGIEAAPETPARFPLGPGRKLLCRTCHRVHGGRQEIAYLRDGEGEGYESRRAFCASCHGRGVAGFNPHLGRPGESRCAFCHTSVPKSGEDGNPLLRDDVLKLCRFCHGVAVDDHQKTVDAAGPFPKGVPVQKDGTGTCNTCHEPHGTTDLVHHLRTEIADARMRSQETSPHVEAYFSCRACHTTSFAEEIRAPDFRLRYHGDRNLLCLSCHVTEQAHHPGGIPLPKTVRFRYDASPLKVPLDDAGRITCSTCHDNGCSTGHQKMTVRYYDRDSLRADLCWICHDRREFSTYDPHVDDPAQCRWCHQTRPVPGPNVLKTLSASPTMICLLCHEPGRHPAGADHLKVPSEKYRPGRRLPLGPTGEVTCATCHDPHIQPVPLPRRFRLEGSSLCNECHRR